MMKKTSPKILLASSSLSRISLVTRRHKLSLEVLLDVCAWEEDCHSISKKIYVALLFSVQNGFTLTPDGLLWDSVDHEHMKNKLAWYCISSMPLILCLRKVEYL